MNIRLKNAVDRFLNKAPAEKREEYLESLIGYALAANMDVPSAPVQDPMKYFNDLYASPTKDALSDLVETIPADISAIYTHARTLWMFSYDMIYNRKTHHISWMMMVGGFRNENSGLGKALTGFGWQNPAEIDSLESVAIVNLIDVLGKYYGHECKE